MIAHTQAVAGVWGAGGFCSCFNNRNFESQHSETEAHNLSGECWVFQYARAELSNVQVSVCCPWIGCRSSCAAWMMHMDKHVIAQFHMLSLYLIDY